MKNMPKWFAIGLIAVGTAGFALNFSKSDAGAPAPQIDLSSTISADQTQQAGSPAVTKGSDKASDSNDKWQKIEKRWEFGSGEFKTLYASTSSYIHIQVKTDAATDYLELRGIVSKEAAERAANTTGETNGIKLDLTDPSRVDLFSLGQTKREVYLTLGLKDVGQLEDASFAMGSGTGDLGSFSAKNLNIELSSGDLDAERLSAEQISIDMKSGNIDIDELNGPSRIELSSGKVQINALAGDSVIRATSGSIDLIQRQSGNVNIEMSSGNTNIQSAEDFVGIYDTKATSGTIDVPDSPGKSKDTIKVRTTSGNITITP